MSGADRVRGLCLACFALLIALVAASGRAGAGSPVVVHLRIAGIINPIEARYVERSLARAEADGASLVVLSIDTPGGLVSSMQDIVGAITRSKVPVVGLVEPRTAQATSAGAFILLATDVAAMLPDTRVGAAHPVGEGKNLDGAMEQKATNSLASLARSLAARRGRPEKTAEAMVRDSVSFTANEAKNEKLVEFVVPGLGELVRQLDGYRIEAPDRSVTLDTRGASIIETPLSPLNRLLDKLADPTLASLFMTIGVLGILYELSTPGVGMGGIVGVTCLALGLLAMSVLPVNAVGAVLLFAGLVALAVELAFPTHGLVGGGGVLTLMLGVLFLVDEARYFGAVQHVRLAVFLPVILVFAALFFGLARLSLRTRKLRPQSGMEAMPGRRGVVKEALAERAGEHTGMVFVDGALFAATAATPIPAGARVEVVRVHSEPTRLEVRPVEQVDRSDQGDV